jgi:hypothetical protein
MRPQRFGCDTTRTKSPNANVWGQGARRGESATTGSGCRHVEVTKRFYQTSKPPGIGQNPGDRAPRVSNAFLTRAGRLWRTSTREPKRPVELYRILSDGGCGIFPFCVCPTVTPVCPTSYPRSLAANGYVHQLPMTPAQRLRLTMTARIVAGRATFGTRESFGRRSYA